MAIKRLNVASEDTLQGVKSDVADVKTDVAGVKVDVASVNSNIGGTDDTGGSSSEGTSMAKLNYLIESLKNVLNSTVGTTGLKTLDKIIEEKVNSAVSSITANGGVKVVKSVQRGVYTIEYASVDNNEITINSITPSKSLVLLQGDPGINDEADRGSNMPFVQSLTSTSITIGFSNTPKRNLDVGWQVIEFY